MHKHFTEKEIRQMANKHVSRQSFTNQANAY